MTHQRMIHNRDVQRQRDWESRRGPSRPELEPELDTNTEARPHSEARVTMFPSSDGALVIDGVRWSFNLREGATVDEALALISTARMIQQLVEDEHENEVYFQTGATRQPRNDGSARGTPANVDSNSLADKFFAMRGPKGEQIEYKDYIGIRLINRSGKTKMQFAQEYNGKLAWVGGQTLSDASENAALDYLRDFIPETEWPQVGDEDGLTFNKSFRAYGYKADGKYWIFVGFEPL